MYAFETCCAKNIPSSHKQLATLTTNIVGYRLNMIIREYGEIMVEIIIYIFGCQSLLGVGRSPPSTPPLDRS